MRRLIFSLAVLALACGRPDALDGRALSGDVAATPAATPSSPLAAAVIPLTAGLAFQPFLPDGLPPDLAVTAALYGSPVLGPRPLGDPILSITLSKTAGTKEWLRIVEGPEGCCPDFSQDPYRAASREVVIRQGQPTSLTGEIYPPGSANQGPTLRWREPSPSGGATEIVLSSTTFGPYGDEQSLLDVARQMRPLPRASATDTVRLYLSTHVSHSPTGHRVSIAARSGPLPDAARLLDGAGATIATTRFETPRPPECLAASAAVAAFAVPEDVVNAFSRGIASGYRAEVLVGGKWRPVQLINSGCFSSE